MNARDSVALRPAALDGAAARHIVRFYESPASLHTAVAAFLSDGLSAGESALLFGRPVTRSAVRSVLDSSGFDVAAGERSGRIRLLDAAATLDRILVDGRPDATRFRTVVGGAFADAAGGAARARVSVRAFGEMVDELLDRGAPEAALQLEALWNEYLADRPLTLLCAYAIERFARDSAGAAFASICDQHGHVIPAESYSELINEEQRSREISALQQRARALEAEIERRKELEMALRAALAERDRSELALKTARDAAENASRAKSDFLAVMSHELRTPLNAIMGYDELLTMEVGGPITAEQRTFLARIRSAAQQLLGLVDQILSLSRIEAGKEQLRLEDVDIAAIASDAVALVEADARLKGLDVHISADTPLLCRSDGSKVRQILLNLLSNAVKFTDEGAIDITVRRDDDGDGICIAVRDTGPGLPPEDRDRIFERFVQGDSSRTRRRGGTGLGLAVSRDLARLLGGDVSLAAGGTGTGSTFTLRLPASGHPA